VTDGRRLEKALAPIVPDERDREFVARCILGEGPAHHRAASWALVVLAAEVAARLGAAPLPSATGVDALSVRLRLPPDARDDDDDGSFPLRLPLAPLRTILDDERDVEAMADALTDGPPHHALANAALVALLHQILEHLGARLAR
jgi:hypothetical protein